MIILTFHGVGPIPRNVHHDERNCWLEEDHFEALLDLVQGKEQVQLTFDDGNASDAEIVLPALVRRGMKATFFVCSGRVDTPTFLSKAQVRELREHCMIVGSHGIAHISWRRLASARLREELEDSRRDLEQICGETIDAAACPFGAYDRAVLSGLRRARYRWIYTSDGGFCEAGSWLRGRNTVTRLHDVSDVALLIQRGPGMLKSAAIRARQLLKRWR
jgi:peptidoglycan/xylan/chitin deacetylase (PgdA/CDA1 family)